MRLSSSISQSKSRFVLEYSDFTNIIFRRWSINVRQALTSENDFWAPDGDKGKMPLFMRDNPIS